MRRRVLSVAIATAAATAGAAVPAAQADIAQSAVVSQNPVNTTPNVTDGTVRAIAVVGSKVVVAGNFDHVKNAGSSTSISRHNIFAFDAKTGKVDTKFVPKVDGTVYALQAGTSNTVYVGGSFTTTNGVGLGSLTKLSVTTGKAVSGFNARVGHGLIFTMIRRGSHVYIGGEFTTIAGKTHAPLARVDATTGKDAGLNLSVTTPRSGALKVYRMAVDPADKHLVIDGTFTQVAGKRRYQIAMINTSGTPALSSWATERYATPCSSSFDTYMRGIDFAPDGSYFVVVTTGAPHGTSQLCDSAARWETSKTGAGQNPTWVNWTGGDTLLSVSVTGKAIYVGGHQRWMDNPQGHDSAGPGAVSRPGIAALNPSGGKALSWNPTRTRGHGVEALVATSSGLYVGSDTDELGHEYHGRIGEFPLS
ncbi:hypothetical protein [Actinoallomurus iriomotensis]|uniref:Uncharacterized protein n=1 Tax=Actinoallomurus iriomotensis TaxID=478107 RepID=A0A9W6S353_9ACTN|nr:hypothetical protein [Actinoallomurus iriomotensis]GLY84912.1 hypothetical protein Airi02_028410 [Actinoallomurus iriomotensis]